MLVANNSQMIRARTKQNILIIKQAYHQVLYSLQIPKYLVLLCLQMVFFKQAAVSQSVRALERSTRMRNVVCSNPSRDRQTSLNQVVTAPLINAWQLESPEMTVITGCPVSQFQCMLKNPQCSMAMSAEYRSKLHPFIVNGDVSVWSGT